MPDAMSMSGLMISAPSSPQKSLHSARRHECYTLADHLLPGADDAPLVLPTVSTPFRTTTLLS